MNRFPIILLITAIFIASCENNEDVVKTDENSLQGEWEVNAYIDDTFIYGPFSLQTDDGVFLTNDSMLLRDTAKDFWNFQVKVAAERGEETFETQKSICEVCEYNIGIKIFNGRIFNSDSIYLEIQFEDDETPYGNTYQLKGYKVN